MTHWRDTPPEVRAEKKAEAERRMRAGESRTDIALALGVCVSTIGRWSREGGWRRTDLGMTTWTQASVDALRAEAALPPPVASDPMSAAREAMARALRLEAAGRLAEADRQARLAERYIRLAERFRQASDRDRQAADEAAAGESRRAELLAELDRRLDRLVAGPDGGGHGSYDGFDGYAG